MVPKRFGHTPAGRGRYKAAAGDEGSGAVAESGAETVTVAVTEAVTATATAPVTVAASAMPRSSADTASNGRAVPVVVGTLGASVPSAIRAQQLAGGALSGSALLRIKSEARFKTAVGGDSDTMGPCRPSTTTR